MNRSLLKITAYLQLGLTILLATGCAPTQPFFLNESPDLQYYLNSATRIEYPDVEVESLAETTQAQAPLTIGNHDYQFWDLSLEECVSIALQNAKFFVTTSGNAEFRQNVAAQFTSASADQLGSIYDIGIQQSTTQSIPLTIDGNGNRTLPRGVLRANQVGGVEDALAEFDAQASGFLNFSTTDRPRNSGASQVSVSQAEGTDITQQAALSKRFATGGIATFREQVSYSRNNLPATINNLGGAGRIVSSDYTTILEAEIQHPLMRNRGTLINRIPVVLASLNEDIAITDFEVQVRNLVRDVEVAYWNLYVSYRNVSTIIIGRNSAIATAKFAQLNLDAGTGTQQDVAQSNGQYYAFRAQLEGALAGSNVPGDDRTGVYGSERVMRELLGLASTDGRLIRPIEEPTLARTEFDWDESVVQMLYLSPELRRARTIIKQRELEQMSAKNQILPEVNLSLLYRMIGIGDTFGPSSRRDVNFPSPGSSSLGELTEGNYTEGQIRLEITPPAIGGRRERARIRGSQFRLVQSRAFIQDAERLLVSQLADAVAKASTHYQLVQTRAQQWQAHETEVEARLAEFKGGRAQVNVVLQSQQRRADAQIAYYRALGEYNKSLNYIDYLKGTMLANSNIVLAEGPWNKKAYWDALERARERSAGKKVKYGVSRPSVVRQGPVREPSAAGDVIGSATSSYGEALPPEGVILNGPHDAMDLQGLDLQPYRESVEVNDMPLSDIGSTPNEMLSPMNGIPEVPSMVPSQPTEGSPQIVPNSIQLPSPDSLPDGPGANVVPINYESDLDISNAPKPVRRRPLPSR
ncbi:MAG: TolC family protein [Rubripirellula sp.]